MTKAILRMPADFWCNFPMSDGWMIREFGAAGDVDLPLRVEFWGVKWGPRLLLGARPPASSPRVHLPRSGAEPNSRVRRSAGSRGASSAGSGGSCMTRRVSILRPSDVIYGGVSPQKFFCRRSPADYADGPLRLLYVGYVDPKRGLHTIVEAMGLLSISERDRT